MAVADSENGGLPASGEETPLLNDEVRKHEEVYNRFTPAQKRTITALISLAGLFPCELFSTGDSDDP